MGIKYDFLIVGSGLFGATFAQKCKEAGKTCLVIDKRNHIAGNVYTERVESIDVHRYGPHIFHTNNETIWKYVNRFTEFTQYVHRVKVNYQGKIYTMPINLQTMYEVYGISTPEEARKKLEEVRVPIANPKNLEEWCLSRVGPELYHTFICGYTTKQWGREPKELPASIIKRLPIRLSFDDRWHQSIHSGIPSNGYTAMVANMLDGVQVELGVDYFGKDWTPYAHRIVYTGAIDKLFDYCYGQLEYRTLRFDTKTLDGDYQGVVQMNYTDAAIPYTRIVEHKHFTYKTCDKTVVTWEYPAQWQQGSEPYYPVNDERNDELYRKYKELTPVNMIIGGRLGTFKYLDMAPTILQALNISEKTLL